MAEVYMRVDLPDFLKLIIEELAANFTKSQHEMLLKIETSMSRRFTEVDIRLEHLEKSENRLMINVQSLLDAVNNETEVDQKILTLLGHVITAQKSLSQQLADAIAANDPAGLKAVQDAIDASVATMTENAANITAAVTNTPDPEATPTPVPVDPAPPTGTTGS